MSVLAAGTLCREHLRQTERLAWDVIVLKNVAEGRAETLYASYAARIRHEREVWEAGLTQLADELDALLDVEGAVAYAQTNWTPVVPLPAGKALWAAVRKQDPPEGWRSPNADEVAARLAASQPHTDAWILGALQVYLGMAMQTSQEAGTTSLRHLGKGVTWEWADPRQMARDLYQVRGSKVVQQMYGAHIDQLRNIILSATDPRNPKTLAQVRSLIKESWPALRRFQIDRIARTETATIWTHTSMQAYAANGVEHWESTIAHGPTIGVESENPCPECVAEALYLHDMSDDWPPWHPNCRCEAVPIFEDPDSGEVWLPPDEPWAGGAGVGEELAIVEGTEAAAVRYPVSNGPILSPAPLPGERMAYRPSTQVATEPYRQPRRFADRPLPEKWASGQEWINNAVTKIPYKPIRTGAFEKAPVKRVDLSRIVATEREGFYGEPTATAAPINVVKLGDRYYVEDGHHRVYAAIERGETSIEARVTQGSAYARQRHIGSYTPEGDMRAMITSCNNRISGLKTRLKKTDDPAKRAELEARLEEQYRLRAELKGKLGEMPPTPPPPVTPPSIPDKPWALDDYQATFEDVLSGYRGHQLRVTWESGGRVEGTLTREGEYWLLDGKTLGNGRGVATIEARVGERWAKVAEKPAPPALKLPERPIILDAGDERVLQVLRNLEGHEARLYYVDGGQIEGRVVYDNLTQQFYLVEQAVPFGRNQVFMPSELGVGVARIEVRVVEDNVVRYVTVARAELKSVEELKAELTSAGNKLSGLKTRLKRELQRTQPRTTEVVSIQERIRVLEADRDRLRAAIEEARGRPALPPERPPGLVEPPVSPEVVRPPEPVLVDGGIYLERGPGSSPLADELAQLRAEMLKRIAGGLESDLDRAVSVVVRAGERIQAELDAQGVRHLDEAIARAKTEKALVDARGAEIDARIRELEGRYVDARQERTLSLYGRFSEDLPYTERVKVENEINHLPEMQQYLRPLLDARAEKTSWYDDAAASNGVVRVAEQEKLVAERENLMNVLNGVRDVGPSAEVRLQYMERNLTSTRIDTGTGRGKYKARSFEKTKKVLEDAQRFLPRSWLRVQRQIDAGWIGRGHHTNHGSYQEIRVSSSDRSKIGSDRDGLSTGIHELGHEVEDTVTGISRLERAFYERRTAGEPLKHIKGCKAHEKGRDDEFSDPYMGKYYDGRSYEIVSMGLESIWTGSFRLDPEYRSFMLGLLGLV